MNTNNQDKIDRYLLNKMPEDERRSFEQELETDPDLNNDYLFTKALKEELGYRAEIEEKMSRWNEEIEQSSKKKALTKRKWIYTVTSLAAIAVFGFFFTFLNNNVSDTTESGALRGTDTHFTDIVSLIENKQYKEALSVINDKEIENEGMINYYQSLCPDSTINDDTSETGLPTPPEETISPEEAQEIIADAMQDQIELKWLKANAYIGLNQKEKALTELKEITDDDNPYSKKAKELIKKLK